MIRLVCSHFTFLLFWKNFNLIKAIFSVKSVGHSLRPLWLDFDSAASYIIYRFCKRELLAEWSSVKLCFKVR